MLIVLLAELAETNDPKGFPHLKNSHGELPVRDSATPRVQELHNSLGLGKEIVTRLSLNEKEGHREDGDQETQEDGMSLVDSTEASLGSPLERTPGVTTQELQRHESSQPEDSQAKGLSKWVANLTYRVEEQQESVQSTASLTTRG